MLNRRVSLVVAASALVAALAWAPVAADAPALPYAITGARVVTGTGATLDHATIVMRDGMIADVGTGVAVPAGAITVDGTGLTVYPGLIDMSNAAAVEPVEVVTAPAAQAPQGRGGAPGFGRGRGGGASGPTRADLERARRDSILHPDFDAAEHVRYEGDQMQRLAAAGITSVLAVPPEGIFRGQSALIDVLAPPEGDEISTVGADRHGLVVVRSGVAEHVAFGGRGGAYPGTLLGAIAFVRQTFDDAQWQQEARSWAARHPSTPRPAFEPALDALVPALSGRMPVAFEAGSEREILRALAMAAEFKLTPIIVGGIEAPAVADDLHAAHAAVICAMTFRAGGGGGRGGRGGGATPERVVEIEKNAPKVPAELAKAGIPFAFTSEGLQTPADLVRAVSRAVKEGGLSPDAALGGLTSHAAELAGVADRLGTIEKGKIANLVVTDGDLFDNARIRHVFVDGRPVDIQVPATQPGRGRGRGGR